MKKTQNDFFKVFIEIPQGHDIKGFDVRKGKVSFDKKAKAPIERIKTIEDILNDHEIDIDDFEKECEDLPEDEKAYKLIKLLCKSLNKGWVPDWDNSDEIKFYPWFDMRGGSSGFRFGGCDSRASLSNVGSRLCFKNRKTAKYAGKQFTELYEKFLVIQNQQ